MDAELNAVISILGEENVERIRDEMTNVLIDNFRESCEKNWVVLPLEFSDAFDELCMDIIEKMKKKYKKELTEVIEQNILANIAALKKENKDGRV